MLTPDVNRWPSLAVGAACLATLSLLTACGGASGADPQVPAPIEEQREATQSPPATPSFAAATLEISRSTPTRGLPPVVAKSTSPPRSTQTSAAMPTPSAVPATPTPEPEPTEVRPVPSPTPTLDAAQLILRGKRLVERNNCLGCHSTDGQAASAPTFKGLFESARQLEGGATVTADKAYLRESIKQPDAEIVDGYFTGAMPKVFFNEAELLAMVEYIASLD